MKSRLMARISLILMVLCLVLSTPIDAKSKAKHKRTKSASHHAPLVMLAKPHYETLVMEYPSLRILFSENATTQTQPASLTKVMTLYLVFQALDNGSLKLTQALPISAHAANRQPSKLGLRVGDTITVQDAICGLVTKSANDAASVLAEALGGTEDQFALKMNEQALRLKMLNTTFRNASGTPDRHQLTTAMDMGLLGAAMIRDFPHYYHYFSLREFTYKNRVIKTHNHLLGKYDGCDGIKTGYTAASGFNLLSSALRNGHRLIAVVLGGTSIKSRDLRSMEILSNGFAALQTAQPIYSAPTTPPQIDSASSVAEQPASNATASNNANKLPELEPPSTTTIEEAY